MIGTGGRDGREAHLVCPVADKGPGDKSGGKNPKGGPKPGDKKKR